MTETVYLAGLELDEGGKYSLRLFEKPVDARNYVESLFKEDQERAWSTEPPLDMLDSAHIVESPMYYGFQKDRKGVIEERDIS